MDERYNFPDLFNKNVDFDKDIPVKIDKIVIPKIQRPYAQGRTDEACTYIRQTFLAEIFNALKNEDVLELNFIYGIVRKSNDKYVMELLDGQQRITTLFLLYWYIANRELEENTEKDIAIRKCLKRFVYETRSTSTVFCQTLADFHVDLSNQTPQKAIRSARWYFKSFDRDSTITAMLVMLDAIHDEYEKADSSNLYGSLDKIQFYVKSLGYFNLSEELYIKMNARGLQLSPFENFKADLTNFVSVFPYDKYKESVALEGEMDEIVPFYLNFSTKLDSKWIDIFWNGTEGNFDASYLTFFYRYFTYKFIIDSRKDLTDKDIRTNEIVKELYTNAEKRIAANEYQGFKIFKSMLTQHPEYVLGLNKVLDTFSLYHKSDIGKSFVPIWDRNNDEKIDDFYCNASTTMTQTKLILFAAVIEYIENYPTFEKSTFEKWMRIVWNIVENTNIDSLTPAAGLIRKFSSIVNYTSKLANKNDFYSAFVAWGKDFSDDNDNRAVLEELRKAGRIVNDAEWEKIFVDAERHPYFKGMVLFFYTNGMAKQEYLRRYKLAAQMFDANGISPIFKDGHILIRAIVSNFNNWYTDLYERYFTERAESNKYLKNILASHKDVRKMLAYVLDAGDVDEAKDRLTDFISKDVTFSYWDEATDNDKLATDIAFEKLRKNTKLYDWFSETELTNKGVFRIYYYEGHIMCAIPKKRYARIAIDTDRAEVAKMVTDNYDFAFYNVEQKTMYESIGDCFGNSLWLKQDKKFMTIWVGFLTSHQIALRIECNNPQVTELLRNKFRGSRIDNDNDLLLHLPSEEHYEKAATYATLSKRLDEILSTIEGVFMKKN